MTAETHEIDDGLTEEERAALAAEEGADEGADSAGVDDGKTQEEERAAQQAADKDADDAKTAADAADAAAAAAATADAEERTSEVQQQSAPVLVAPPIEDLNIKLAAIQTNKDSLIEQFDNGDITAREYQKQLDALAREERALERQQFEAEIAQKMEQQRLQNDWSATCNRFVEDNPVYKDNPRLYKALDNEVRDLAAKPETANWSGQRFLEEAHKNLREAFGLPDGKTNTKREITPPRDRNLPPSIAKVPSAEVEDTNGGRFAVLDRLANTDPIAYEDTLAKMSDAERQAYLSAA